MPTNLNPYIQQLSWEEAREMTLKVNPEFVKEVDNVDLPKTCSVFKVKYRYGDYLMENGTIMLRNQDGENVPITHPELPEVLRDKLLYTGTLPMGMVLNKKLEAYFKSRDGRIAPRGLLEPGYILALTGIITRPDLYPHKGAFWNVTAGTRSVYSVPKISISQKHEKLSREFGISYLPPKSYQEQWGIFRELLQSPRLNHHWEMEVLFFSREWIEMYRAKTSPSFNYYLMTKTCDVISYFGNNHVSDFMLSQIESDSNIRRYPNTINAIRHMISIAGGFLPGLSYNCEDDAFPIDLLGMIYRDVYGLEYDPQFLSLKMLNQIGRDNIYYSIALPMSIDYYPDYSPLNTKFAEIRDMAHSLKRIVQTTVTNDYGIESLKESALRGIENAELRVYHSHVTNEPDVLPVAEIPDIKNACNKKHTLNSAIYRGIIGIHPKCKTKKK